MKLFVMRHGETCMNNLNQVCGISDVPLSEKGKLQAIEAAEKLKQKLNNTKINAVYVSPLIRAQQTAEQVKTVLSKVGLWPDNYLIENRLIEQNYGTFEGKSRLDKSFIYSKSQFADRSYNQESLLFVAHRVYSFLSELKQFKNNYDVVLLVTHGAVCRIIHSYFNSMNNEQFGAWRAVNCQVVEYEGAREE